MTTTFWGCLLFNHVTLELSKRKTGLDKYPNRFGLRVSMTDQKIKRLPPVR